MFHCVYMPPFLIHWSVGGHLGCFRVLAIVNRAVMNVEAHVSFSILVTSGYKPSSGIVGSYGGFIPSFLRNLPVDLYQFSSAAQLCLTLCDPMNFSMPGLPVYHQLLESTQTHVHRVSDAIQSSHPLSSPSAPTLNLFQHPQSFPASRSFQMSQLFASGGQSIGVSASAWVLPMNTQDWFPLGLVGSPCSPRDSRVFNTTVQKHQFFVIWWLVHKHCVIELKFTKRVEVKMFSKKAAVDRCFHNVSSHNVHFIIQLCLSIIPQ